MLQTSSTWNLNAARLTLLLQGGIGNVTIGGAGTGTGIGGGPGAGTGRAPAGSRGRQGEGWGAVVGGGESNTQISGTQLHPSSRAPGTGVSAAASEVSRQQGDEGADSFGAPLFAADGSILGAGGLGGGRDGAPWIRGKEFGGGGSIAGVCQPERIARDACNGRLSSA